MTTSPAPSAFCLVGPTAVGKTRVAQAIAAAWGGRILSADAMLVYRGMDVGTAKPPPASRGAVPYYGLDLVAPTEPFSVAAWLERARPVFEPSPAGRVPPVIAVGGTGLYFRCLVEGLRGSGAPDPDQRARWETLWTTGGLAALQAALAERDPGALAGLADPRNPRRLIRALERAAGGTPADAPAGRWSDRPTHVPFVGLRMPAAALHSAIELRVRAMYADGLIEEVERWRAARPPWSATARQAIGYAEALDWLEGRCSREDAMTRTVIRTRQYAKRQRTWFERQANVSWIDDVHTLAPAEIAAAVEARWAALGPTVLEGLRP